MNETWRTLDSRYILKRWWMNLRVDHVRLPGGAEIEEFHVVEYPDWSCVVCMTKEGKLVLVRQYRHGIGRTSLELPAGALNKNEDPLAGVKRELLEETGYVASDWQVLGSCAQEPSKHTNLAYMFYASDGTLVAEPEQDPTEQLTVEIHTPASVLEFIETGDICHGIHMLALFTALQKGCIRL